MLLGKADDIYKITDEDSIRKTMKKLKREDLRRRLSKSNKENNKKQHNK